LANQSVSQLRSGDINVAAELASNVSVRLFLTADSEEDIADIQRLSGEAPQWAASIGVSTSRLDGVGRSSSTNWSHADSTSRGVSFGFSEMWSDFHTSSSSSSGGVTTFGGSSGRSEGHGTQDSVQLGKGASDSKGGDESKSQQESDTDGTTLSFTEAPRPAVHLNEVLDTSSRQLACFLWVRHDLKDRDGFRGRLIPMQALRCLDEEEFRARDSTPWQRDHAERQQVGASKDAPLHAVANGPPENPTPPVTSAANGPPDDQWEHIDRLKALFESELPPPIGTRQSHE
jgi:hypothetical protein